MIAVKLVVKFYAVKKILQIYCWDILIYASLYICVRVYAFMYVGVVMQKSNGSSYRGQ